MYVCNLLIYLSMEMSQYMTQLQQVYLYKGTIRVVYANDNRYENLFLEREYMLRPIYRSLIRIYFRVICQSVNNCSYTKLRSVPLIHSRNSSDLLQ